MDSLIAVRAAQRADLPHLAKLAAKLVRLHHAFDPERFFCPDQVEQGYEWWFGQELGREQVVLLAAERGDRLIGYVYGRLEERDWNQLLDACGALHDLWVEEEYRRSGVATRLVGAAIQALTDKGAPRVVLHTAAPNEAAQRFFERLGFRRTMVEMTRESDSDLE